MRRAVREYRAARAFCFTLFLARQKHVKTNVVEKGQWGREIEVEIAPERVEKELNKAYRNYQKRIEVPGFRKGKVPLRIIETRYGESIRGEVIGDMLPTFLEEATREAGLVPAAPPKISKIDHEPGAALTFTATLDIWPEIELETYEKLECTRMAHEIADEEVDSQLQELQTRQATERAVERPLGQGDVLIADLQRLDESGTPIIGEKFEERYFLIGDENAPSPEFEEALVGISAGDERNVQFSYREDLPNEELKGKTEHFAVTAREVRERTLPELDDEFAKDVGEQFQTLEDLRNNIKQQIEERWQYMAKQRERNELVSQLIEKNPFDLPDSMVENYLVSMQREKQSQNQNQQDHSHHDHDHDHDHDHSDEDREGAIRRLKSYLLTEAVRKKAEIDVSDEEFEQYLEERAKQAGVQIEDIKRSGRADDLRSELSEDKVFALLSEKAVIKEEKV
jgi:trigger factor